MVVRGRFRSASEMERLHDVPVVQPLLESSLGGVGDTMKPASGERRAALTQSQQPLHHGVPIAMGHGPA